MLKSFSIITIVSCLSLSILSGCTRDTTVSIQPTMNPPTASATPVIRSSVESQVVHTTLHSTALDRKMDLSIYLPPNYSTDIRYPVLYLLYGYGNTPDSWFTNLKLDHVANRLIQTKKIEPLIIVAPDYGNSFGVNSKAGEGKDPGNVHIGNYEDYLMKDVISYVDSQFSTQASKEGRSIGGISMGGYAALYLGFSHSELFSKVGAHSAAIWDYSSTDLYTEQRDWLYANEALREARDPFKLAENKKLDDIQVYLDSGNIDPLREKDYSLYDFLLSKDVDVQWVQKAGGHDSAYWSSQLENYLLFYTGNQIEQTIITEQTQTSEQEIWKVQTRGRITSSPLLVDGRIYFGSDDHNLYAVDHVTGKVDWSFTADSPIRSNPKSSGTSIVFQSHLGTIYKLDAESGAEEWRVSFSAPVLIGEQDIWDYYDSSASIDGKVLYIGRADSHLYALNSDTGELLWNYKAEAAIKSSPIHDETSVYFGDWEGYIYALDKKNGTLQWKYKTEPFNSHVAIQSNPVLHNDVIYWGARNFKLYAFDTKNGEVLWEKMKPAWASSPIYQDDTLYVGNSNGDFMSAVDPKTGTEKWRFDTNSNVLSAPVYSNGLLFFGSGYAYEYLDKDDFLFAVNASTGQLVWKIASGKIQATPVVEGGVVYYTGFDGALHAIKMEELLH